MDNAVCVLFFDEFDAVGKERGDTHETGEIKRVVTSLLMQIDDLPSYVVVIAATNHAAARGTDSKWGEATRPSL
jgi:ATP-dependent 26S proteasome regulatory subunit